MFCTECICHQCPYGLRCWTCDRELDGHLLIVEGCNGTRESDKCPLDSIAPEHAETLRKIITEQDAAAMEAYFNLETGPWYNQKIKG